MAEQSQVSRRALLGLLAGGATAVTGCGMQTATGNSPATTAPTPDPIKIRYGPDSSQWGELHLPTGTRKQGTAVIIHGGFWLSEYGADLGTPLAADLARRGWAAWNLEYRRVGDGGGWPATLQDVATGIDKLTDLAAGGSYGHLDLTQVVAIGHSAGGQLAAWLAARPHLAAGAPGAFTARRKGAVAVTGVVSQAGVLDLTVAAAAGVGGSSVPDLLGGGVAEYPDRYQIADPIKHLPLGVPVHCVHSKDDGNVPYSQSTAYVAAAVKAGDVTKLHTVQGDHFSLIDATSDAWTVVVDLLPELCNA
ncbi:MAG: alpha/beta hydrolase [Actinomycetota bacterium]|nr:alpha/beta hydrolase [Actinomycetota bacterium]